MSLPYNPEITLKDIEPLVYPTDANPEDFFPECIRFGVHKRDGNSLEKMTSELSASLKKLVATSPTKTIRGVYNGVKRMIEEGVGVIIDGNQEKTVAFATKLMSGAFAEGNGTLKSNKQTRKPIGSIYMNMPNSIQFSEGANWAGQGLGVAGDQAMRMSSSGDTSGIGARATGLVAGNIGNIAGGAVGTMIGTLTSTLGLAAGFAVGAFAGENLQRGVEKGLSIKQNPYMEMMFEGIGFRAFRFDFVLRPRDIKEVEVVANILKAFREYSRPSWNPALGGTSFMNYPMEFDIEFLTLDDSEATFAQGVDGKTRKHSGSFTVNNYLPKLKSCVLSNVETNFTPQSIWAAHDAGAPVAVTLGLAFQETELVMAEDIQRGDWPTNKKNDPNSSNPSSSQTPARSIFT